MKKQHFSQWVKNLSSYTKNKTINSLLFFIAFFIIGGTSQWMMFKVFVPTFFILDFFVICFLISPIFFFKKTMFDRIYLPIIILLLTVFYVLNSCYFTAVGTVFSIKELILSIQNIVQVAVHTAMIPWNIIGTNIALLVVFVASIVLFNCLWSFRYSKDELKKSRKNKIIFAVSLLCGSVLLRNFSFEMWRLSENKKQRYDINYVNYNPLYHYKNLGMSSYYIQELRQIMFDKGESVENIRTYLNNCSFLEDDFTGLLKQGGRQQTSLLLWLKQEMRLC